MAKVSAWLFKALWLGLHEYRSEELELLPSEDNWAQISKYIQINHCRPSSGLLLEEDMSYLDNFFNFSLYGGKYDLYLSRGEDELNVFFSLRNTSLLYSSHSIWIVTASAYRKSSLWTGGLPGLRSHQTLSHHCSYSQGVWGLCLSQALVLTGSKDKYLSVTINSCYFKIFYLNVPQNLGVMIGSSFSLCFHLWLQFY